MALLSKTLGPNLFDLCRGKLSTAENFVIAEPNLDFLELIPLHSSLANTLSHGRDSKI